ncbi:MAG: hypothetical protein FWC60_09310 [Firmicutes bacterium]|nr:hypothetical protein [Bacillota bacterium]
MPAKKFVSGRLVTGQTLCLLVPVAQARKVINRKRFLEEYKHTVYSRFEVRGSRFEAMQCLLILKAQARQTINRKRFLEEHERTVNSLACRSMLNSNA